jgi:pyrroline-5-carboxylate reductase
VSALGRRGLAIIGGGKIGEALLSGLIRRGGTDGILVCERSPERAAQLAERYGVPAVDLGSAATRARVLLLAVKPQDIDVLLGRLAEHVDDGHLVVSVAAGVPTARIEAALPAGVPVVRVMPNTPALVDEGMSVLSAGAHAAEADLDEAEALLAAVGGCRSRSRTPSRPCPAADRRTSSTWSRPWSTRGSCWACRAPWRWI